jgi:hypothetical protein
MQTQFDQVVSEIHEDIEMFSIADVIARAQTGLENIQDSPNLPPGVFVPGDDLNRVTDARNALTSRTFWTRPFLQTLVFSIGPWFSATPPREPDNPDRVFDPTLSLPALLVAIQIYCAATTLLAGIDGGGPLPQPWKDHIDDLATKLDAFHSEIARGIVDLRVPTLPEATSPQGQTIFEFFNQPFGAAFLYSQKNIVDAYPLEQDFPKSLPDWPQAYPLFAVRIKPGNIARRKALYMVLNLPDTWQTVQNLRVTGQKTAPAVVNPFDGWSMSEVSRIVGESFPPDPNALQVGISIRDIMGKLRTVLNPNALAPLPKITGDPGLRELLTLVTP